MRGTAFPSHFTNPERSRLVTLLEEGRRCGQPYDGDWLADWLLSELHDDVWLLRNPDTRRVAGMWKRAKAVYWRQPLTDGTFLTDKCNKQALDAAQRLSFLIRFLPSMGIESTEVHAQWIGKFITVIQWVYLNSDLYRPRTHFLSLVDSHGIYDFLGSWIHGSKAWLMKHPQRCLIAFYSGAFGKAPPIDVLDDLFCLPEDDRNQIIRWLEKKGLYGEAKFGHWPYRYVSRARLAKLLHVGYVELSSTKFAAFLRQFEPDLIDAFPHLLVPSDRLSTEYLSHKIPTIHEAVNSTASVATYRPYAELWRQLVRLHRHLPHALPPPGQIDFRPTKEYERMCTPIASTPWLPLTTALTYTREALRWVAISGEPLINFYIRALKHFKRTDLFNHPTDSVFVQKTKRDARNLWITKNKPDSLVHLNICGWTTLFTHTRADNIFDKLRNQPSLNDALHILVGAIVLLIGITKPLRESELRALRRNCVSFKKGDGYWLEHQTRKRGVGNHLPDSERPIPFVTARAIKLLGKLSEAMVQLVESNDRYAKDSLFFLPLFSRTGSLGARLIGSHAISECLDRFCDYIAIPPDELGRRWYVRVHELRKSFLITFFWCFKYSSLDAAAYMAGHRNPEAVYAYIRANFPGEELTHVEAEYAAQQLRDYVDAGKRSELENVERMYDDVCTHFGVSEISLIAESELIEWLEFAFERQLYEIKPYRIESEKHEIAVSIAFEISKGAQSNAKQRKSSAIDRSHEETQ